MMHEQGIAWMISGGVPHEPRRGAARPRALRHELALSRPTATPSMPRTRFSLRRCRGRTAPSIDVGPATPDCCAPDRPTTPGEHQHDVDPVTRCRRRRHRRRSAPATPRRRGRCSTGGRRRRTPPPRVAARSGDAAFGELLYDADEPRVPARRRGARQPRLRQSDRRRGAAARRGRARPRVGRRHRRPAVRAARRPDGLRLRPRHDRRDARARARTTRPRPGATNVEFRKGRIESIPLDDASVDVVISNCVINLSTDKAAVLAESRPRPATRRPDRHQRCRRRRCPVARRAGRARHASPAASRGRSRSRSTAPASRPSASSTIAVEPTHAVGDGLHGAIVARDEAGRLDRRTPSDRSTCRSRRPGVGAGRDRRPAAAAGGGCC